MSRSFVVKDLLCRISPTSQTQPSRAQNMLDGADMDAYQRAAALGQLYEAAPGPAAPPHVPPHVRASSPSGDPLSSMQHPPLTAASHRPTQPVGIRPICSTIALSEPTSTLSRGSLHLSLPPHFR